MSPPPCTLFCRAAGPGPEPYRPTWPGEQGQVDEREHVVGRVVVLGDAEGPADLCPVGAGVVVRQLPDEVGGHAGVALGPLQRVRLHGRRVGVEAGGGPVDERLVHQAGLDDLLGDGVRQEMSDPTSMPSHASAHCAEVVRRGSTAYSRAPFRTPFSTWWKKIGCASRAFEPHRTAGRRLPPPG
jgi:hypothetical protein